MGVGVGPLFVLLRFVFVLAKLVTPLSHMVKFPHLMQKGSMGLAE